MVHCACKIKRLGLCIDMYRQFDFTLHNYDLT